MTSGNRAQTDAHEWSNRRDQDDSRTYRDERRGRTPSPRPRGGYRDRDREGYRSSAQNSRSRSQSPRRERSPYYGGPPSREIMMDGLPLDMVEEDVGLPNTKISISPPLYHLALPKYLCVGSWLSHSVWPVPGQCLGL